MEDEKIEQIVDQKSQETIAEGQIDRQIMTTTEIRKQSKEEAKWYRAQQLHSTG